MKCKSIVFSLCFMIFGQEVKAQYVTIPDQDFRNILIKKHPDCFNLNNQMDTTCAEIVHDTVLHLSSALIHDLEGMQYFDSLKELYCYNNRLNNIPKFPSRLEILDLESSGYRNISTLQLPAGLKVFNCGGTGTSTLPTLPSGLTTLELYFNQISSLPELPMGLKVLQCSGNPIASLPKLPDLEMLLCETSLLTELPELPESLKHLRCSINKLTSLPKLPSKLEYLFCDSNFISTLPTLPDSLIELRISKNILKNLPPLPAKLRHLDCSNNQLINLPELPDRIQYVGCADNKITSIPNLPDKINYLYCSRNKITCFPFFPPSLQQLNFYNNPVGCVPNTTWWLKFIVADYPICNTTNNKNQCTAFPALKGIVFIDENKDGIFNKGETPVPQFPIKVAEPSKVATFSSQSGEYHLVVDTTGTFTFNPGSLDYYTALPGSKTVNFTRYGQEIIQDFALHANASVENLETTINQFNGTRPGFPLYFQVKYKNTGTVKTQTSKSFYYPSDFTIDSITGGGSITAPGKITFNNALLLPFQEEKFTVYGRLSPNTVIGTSILFYSEVNPNSLNDINLKDNKDTIIALVSGSFDPNDKESTPKLSPFQVEKGEFIEYKIQFENTGNDSAFTIVVMDTLSTDLNANTLQMISSSHNCKTTVKGNVVSFEFINIGLLWSSLNKQESQGYVNFKVKPVTSLTEGDVVDNKASIYFDYNKPIVTNTAKTNITLPLITGTSENANYEKPANFLAPNPASTKVTLADKGFVEIYSSTGHLLFQQYVYNHSVDIAFLPKGLYHVVLTTADEKRSARLIKE